MQKLILIGIVLAIVLSGCIDRSNSQNQNPQDGINSPPFPDTASDSDGTGTDIPFPAIEDNDGVSSELPF